MAPPKRCYGKSGLTSSHRQLTVPNTTNDDRMSTRPTQSFSANHFQERGASSTRNSEESQVSAEVGSSFEHAGQILPQIDVEQNLTNILDGLFESDQNQKSETVLCTINNCNRVFPSKLSLNKHQSRIHGIPAAVVCSVCSLRFAHSQNLHRHVRYLPLSQNFKNCMKSL